MGNKPLEPIKEGGLLLRPWTDYYTFVEDIAHGNYGFVCLVKSNIDNKQYVIKKIKTSKFNEKENELVKQEIKLLMDLKKYKHPFLM